MMSGWLIPPVAPVLAVTLSWALVGAAIVTWGWPRMSTPHDVARASRQIRGPAWLLACAAGLMVLLAVWPGSGWSGYAALTLQSPSLVSMSWSLLLLAKSAGWNPRPHESRPMPAFAWGLLCLLGWGLVIDTLNFWPRAWDVALYAWGFSSGALWFSALLLMALAWRGAGTWVWQAVGILLAYALLRWPSGNLWDAWLDPVVWVHAHVQVTRAGWRCLRTRLTH